MLSLCRDSQKHCHGIMSCQNAVVMTRQVKTLSRCHVMLKRCRYVTSGRKIVTVSCHVMSKRCRCVTTGKNTVTVSCHVETLSLCRDKRKLSLCHVMLKHWQCCGAMSCQNVVALSQHGKTHCHGVMSCPNAVAVSRQVKTLSLCHVMSKRCLCVATGKNIVTRVTSCRNFVAVSRQVKTLSRCLVNKHYHCVMSCQTLSLCLNR